MDSNQTKKTNDDIPAVDPDTPLKADQKREAEKAIPPTNTDAPLKVEEKMKSQANIPAVDPDAPLKVEEKGEAQKDIPVSNVDATLEVEKLTKPTDVPDSNLNAPLNFDEQASKTHEDPEQQGGSKKLLVIGILFGLLIVVVIIGLIFLRPKVAPEVEEKPKVETKVVEEKKEELDRSEWSFEVLNGTTVKGAAKKLADQLIELGYQVIKTANADASDYTETQLFISKDYKERGDLLLEDLEKEINIASISGELKDSTASARIIIGEDIVDQIVEGE
ncbi:LytR C-terminal domain-containing protein [Candidatus Daviesbacteria bacterium]|nr:LytR C-terminal domain-containing protein [Candidatus Daviesbacteria bacterium]